MVSDSMTNKAKKAYELLANKKYSEALELFFILSKEIGSKFFYFNVAYCLEKFSRDVEINRKIKEVLKNEKFDILENLYSDNFIVSLTSYPGRINTVEIAIKSILRQSFKASKTILWLAKEQFPGRENDLPKSLLNLKDEGLEIEWCDDIRSYKKLIPSLINYPEKIIVTADDDIVYGEHWLLKLLLSYIDNPFAISCHRAHKVKFNENNELLSYRDWPQDIKEKESMFSNFFTGCGGVLYPPNSLNKDVLKREIFTQICPDGDDIWFWAMAVLNNTQIQLVKNSDFKIEFTPESQESALWRNNVSGGNNNKLLTSVFNRYPSVKEKVCYEKIPKTYPKVSVVIPVYNPGVYLVNCLTSLLKQDFSDFEVLCVDDGSTDEKTLDVLQKFCLKDERIKVFRQKNSGPATARNNGLRRAKGDYISFIDADDYVSEGFLGSLYRTALGEKSDIAVAENIICFDGNGVNSNKRSGFEGFKKSRAKNYATESILATGVSWNKLYKKKFLLEKNISYIDGMKCLAEDNYFSAMAIISAENRISIAKNAVYYWRQHEASITKNITISGLEESALVYEMLKEKIDKEKISDRRYWKNIINKRALRDLRFNSKNIENKDFRNSLDKRFASVIDVCCIADENYVTPTMVFLKSVFKTKSLSTKLSITILVPLGAKDKMITLEKLGAEDFLINIVEIDNSQFDSLHKYKDNDNYCMASPSAMFKFVIPDVFKDLDRILYIDTDLIVRKDLMELFMTTMDNDYMCAVVDMWTPVTNREDIKGFKNYFNSGMMLMNLNKMRGDNMPQRLIQAKMRSTNFNLMDQDVFNEVCGSRVRLLDIKYNFLPVCYKRHKQKFKLAEMNAIYGSNYSSIDEIARDPVVVHWAGSEKPWVSSETLFAAEWSEIFESIKWVLEEANCPV